MLQFLNPALLLGAALFTVPLIIHLLNRQRYKRRQWAAMEFLLNAFKKNRRRLRRENLLLLLLRCLIPILLALAIARPLLRDTAGVAGLSGSAHHVLIIDHSYSMGLELQGRTTPFDRAKAMATGLLDRLSGRSNQKVTLLVNGVRPTVRLREEMNLERAKAKVASLEPTVDSATPLTEALLQVADLCEAATDPEIGVYLFTDLQVRAFGEDPFANADEADPARAGRGAEPGGGRDAKEKAPDPGRTQDAKPGEGADDPTQGMFADTAVDAIERIRKTAELTVLDVRSRSGEGGQENNLQITELSLGLPHAIARVSVPVVVKLQNRTAAAQTIQVTLEIDGGQPTRKPVPIDAGAEGEVVFETTFREVGQRRLRASIDGDGLHADNERFAVVTVRERLRVLMVEGSSEDDPSLRESTHLLEILDPTRGQGAPDLTMFEPKVIDKIAFLSVTERLVDYDLIVLCNLDHLNEQAADALLAAVQAGAGLCVMLGDEVDIASYNVQLGRSQKGPLPVQLTTEDGFTAGGDTYYGSEITAPDHPVFSDLGDETYRDLFQSLPIYRFIKSSPAVAEHGQVLARVRDPDLSPLLITSTFGTGKCAFLLSAISRRPDRWNRLDSSIGAVSFLFLHPLAHWLTQPAADPRNVLVGGSLTAVLQGRPFNLAVVPPERQGQGKVLIGEEAKPVLGDRWALPPFNRTDYAGIYEIEMLLDESGGNVRHQEFFAVDPDPVEGDLSYFSHDMAREHLGVDRILAELPSNGQGAVQAGISELGPLLLLLTLCCLCAEAALARFVSRRRS